MILNHQIYIERNYIFSINAITEDYSKNYIISIVTSKI